MKKPPMVLSQISNPRSAPIYSSENNHRTRTACAASRGVPVVIALMASQGLRWR